MLGEYFRRYRKQFGFAAISEPRTQIKERSRYRIPDVLLCPLALPRGKVVNTTPWVVIEILSPDDPISRQRPRFLDYQQLGVPHIVLLDPEDLIAYRFEGRALIETQFTSLELPTGSLPFDTEALFRQLSEERDETGALSETSVPPAEEYLNSSYHPDMEYVDGELVETRRGNHRP